MALISVDNGEKRAMGKDMEKSHIDGPLPEDWPVRITAAVILRNAGLRR